MPGSQPRPGSGSDAVPGRLDGRSFNGLLTRNSYLHTRSAGAADLSCNMPRETSGLDGRLTGRALARTGLRTAVASTGAPSMAVMANMTLCRCRTMDSKAPVLSQETPKERESNRTGRVQKPRPWTDACRHCLAWKCLVSSRRRGHAPCLPQWRLCEHDRSPDVLRGLRRLRLPPVSLFAPLCSPVSPPGDASSMHASRRCGGASHGQASPAGPPRPLMMRSSTLMPTSSTPGCLSRCAHLATCMITRCIALR